MFWATAGYAHLVVDTRGQGSGWTTGATGDPAGSGPSQPGFLTRGIEDPRTYYYRRVYADAVAALEVLRAHHLVDPSGSPWRAGARAAGSRPPSPPWLPPPWPRCCRTSRSCATSGGRPSVAQTDPYLELVRYLAAHRDRVDTVFPTLAYFDGAVLARRPPRRRCSRSR